MRWIKWLGIASAITLIVSCFMEWVVIVSKNITVTGIEAKGTNFGSPGYMHFIFAGIFIVFSIIPKVWAKRPNLLVTALNLAWAIRNFVVISMCSGGECPEKQAGLFIALITSVLMLVAAMFPDIKEKQ